MKNILVIGTFDVLHAGHINLLYRASLEGNVIVGVTSDKLNEVNENKEKLMFNQFLRSKAIESIIFVKKVVIIDPDSGSDLGKIIVDNSIDFVAHGSDHDSEKKEKYFKEKYNVGYIIFDRTDGISSSYLRSKINGGE